MLKLPISQLAVEQHVLVSHVTVFDRRYNEMLHAAAQMLAARGASAADALHQAEGLVYGMVQRFFWLSRRPWRSCGAPHRRTANEPGWRPSIDTCIRGKSNE